MFKSVLKKSAIGLSLGLVMIASASAALFDAGLPEGWTATGNAGAMGANGVVTLAPGQGSQYGYVSTSGGVQGVALVGVGGSGNAYTGSTLRSTVFSAAAGDDLEFFFNYVTSDGSGFADYAWARLLDSDSNQVALLFTARTAPSGSIVPGFSMPTPSAELTPGSVPIIAGDSTWLALGNDSGKCYDGAAAGCGYTGWIQSNYTIANAGSYILEFGVTNWGDATYHSGLAFDGITIRGEEIGTPVSEPAALALLGMSLLVASAAGRRRKSA